MVVRGLVVEAAEVQSERGVVWFHPDRRRLGTFLTKPQLMLIFSN